MRRVVVDASVAVKWLLPEPGSDEAVRLLDDTSVEFHAPELLDVEVSNALWKRTRRGELTTSEAVELGRLIGDFPVTRHSHAKLTDAALRLALDHSIAVYDAAYVALAMALDASFVTADASLREFT